MARILVAEDDVHVMRLMSIWLTKAGHEVLEACNGAEAKDLLKAREVDFVITDANMPVCDGLELVRWLRVDAGLRVPVMMLSARCDQANLGARLGELEVTVHPKPFSPSRLSVEIEARLAAAGVSTEL